MPYGMIPVVWKRVSGPEKRSFLQMPGKEKHRPSLVRDGRTGQGEAYVSQRRRAQDDSAQ